MPLRPARRPVDLYLEAAANPDVARRLAYAPTPMGDRATARREPLYRLERVEIGLLRRGRSGSCEQDLDTLVGLMEQLPAGLDPGGPRSCGRWSDAMDAIDPDDVAATAAAARGPLRRRAGRTRRAPARTGSSAVGHAHIDSAWLWPIRETVRKVRPHVLQRRRA